jgi:membrane associated rhomboid family serine protease
LIAIVASLLAWGLENAIVQQLERNPNAIWDGQVWRLLTSVFFQPNLILLAWNLYWLVRFGRVLEDWLRTEHFLGFCSLAALGSSAAEFLAGGTGPGLSGLVFAMFGLLYSLRNRRDFAAEETQPLVVKVFVCWFILSIALTYGKVTPLSNVAHVVGAIIGWIVGRAIPFGRRSILIGLALGVLALAGACTYMPWNGKYAWHRGQKALAAGKVKEAFYWFQKSERTDSDGPEIRDAANEVR